MFIVVVFIFCYLFTAKYGSSVKCIDEVFAVAVGCGEKTKPIALGIEAYFIGC